MGMALSELERAERDLSAAVARAGFDSLDDALSTAAIDAEGLRRRVRAAEDADAAVAVQLQDPQLAGLAADEHTDVVGLGQAADGRLAKVSARTERRQLTVPRQGEEKLCLESRRRAGRHENRR